MDFYPIRKVTISCPACKTGIKLDVTSTDDAEIENLITASKSFTCPICQAKLGNAHEILKCTRTYNATVTTFKHYQTLFNVEFE